MFSSNSEEVVQSKLLILYIIKTCPTNLSNNELSEFILKKDFMNYFQFQQYIRDLIESEFIIKIVEDKDNIYQISEKGNNTLELFENKIPEMIKEKLLIDFKIKEKEIKREAQISSDLFKKENNQFNVNLKLIENDNVLFSLNLEVSTKEQAEFICNYWKIDPNEIYQEIINIFLKEGSE